MGNIRKSPNMEEKEFEGIKYTLSDTNCHIIDSYKVNSRSQIVRFCDAVLSQAPFNKREVPTYIAEWRAHNFLYMLHIKRESTKDADLDIGESPWRIVVYRLLSVLYIFFDKK